MTEERELKISQETLSRLREHGIASDILVDALFVLNCLYKQDIEILNFLDVSNSDKKVLLLYKTLEYHNFIEKIEQDVHYKLTEYGYNFIHEHNLLKSKSNSKKINLDWIDEWISIFPVKRQDNTYLRSNSQDIKNRMELFIKEYNYPKEIIMEATKAYIEEEKLKDFVYTRMAQYFIFKNEGNSKLTRVSDLAKWCSIIDNNEYKPKNYKLNDDFI